MKRDTESEGTSDNSLEQIRTAVKAYQARGWKAVRLLPGTKMAFERDWPNLSRPPRHFQRTDNVGLRFGPRSGGLCDIDLDYPQARKLISSKVFGLSHLPEFGRTSSPAGERGHRLVICPDAPNRSRVFGIRSKEAKEALAARGVKLTVVEIRGSNGSQTAVPPSVISDDEHDDKLVWSDPDGSAVDVPEISWTELNRQVGLLAFASLAAALYPSEDRPESAQHFMGALREAGVSEDTAADMLMAVAEASGDDPMSYALEGFDRDDTNLTSLCAFLGLPVLEHVMRTWLGLDEDSAATPDMSLSQPRSSSRREYGPGIISPAQLETLLDALDPADFAGYHDYLSIVLAAHHATGGSEEGREVVVQWAARNPEYGLGKKDPRGRPWSDSVRAAWKGAKLDQPNPITLATILHHLWQLGAADVAIAAVRELAREDFDDDGGMQGEEQGADWPRRLRYVYLPDSNAFNGRVFRDARPAPVVTSDGVIYTLGDDGIWREFPKDALRAEIRATNPSDALDVNNVSAMVQAVCDLTYTKARPFEWINPPADAPDPRDLVLFKNGLLDLRTNELRPLDGAYFATGLPGVAYDPSAECPQWLDWIDERLDASYHPTLQEWIGYVMVPDTTAHRFVTFVGPPRSGKSTSKNIIENLVGSDHIARKQLSDMGGDFGLQDTLDKRLIVIPDSKDVPGGHRNQALERLLALTGGDSVGVQRKYLPAVSVKLLTRLLVLGNRQPAWIDESGAMAARQIAINFDRSFEGKEDQGVEDQLMAELPGIANWALEGLVRLRANKYTFTVGAQGKAAVEEVRRSASPALRFAQERLVVTGSDDDIVLQDEVFEAYQQWGKDEGLTGRSLRNKTELMSDLETSLHNVKATQSRKLESPEGWKGGEYRPRVLLGVKKVKLRSWAQYDFR